VCAGRHALSGRQGLSHTAQIGQPSSQGSTNYPFQVYAAGAGVAVEVTQGWSSSAPGWSWSTSCRCSSWREETLALVEV